MKTNSTAITLRVLTNKSKLGFGKYQDMTIADILKINKEYVIWVYYNVSGISFNEELLSQLEINPRIEKPGVDKNAFFKCKRQYSMAHYSKEQRMHYGACKKAIAKRHKKAVLCKAIQAEHYSKGQLQAMNLGRMSNGI